MRRGGRARMGVLAVILLATTGCSWFGDEATPEPPERDALRVSVGDPIATAPLRMAVANGDFTRAGLQVQLVEQTAPEQGLENLKSGKADVAYGSDVTLLRAAASGTSLQIQGEAYLAANLTMALVVLPDSDYNSTSDRRAPRIAVDVPDDLGALTSRSVLTAAGVDPARIRFVRKAFTDMPGALQSGEADAAWMVEPYITSAQKDLGARILTDTARGGTADFPMSGYAASATFAQTNPRTLALFRTVLGQAQQNAADPTTVRRTLPSFSSIDRTTTALIALGTYPSSGNAVRLQRVADLMNASGVLQKRLDVQPLLPPADLP